MHFSVIIPVHNGERTLFRCLQSLRRSTFQDFESIVVDDGSTDASTSIAQASGARVISIQVCRGPARARNVGAAEASASLLVFLDADVEIHADALERLAGHFEKHPELAAVIGSYDDEPLDEGWVSSFKNLMHHYMHQHGSHEASSFWGGLGAMRAEIFREHGGFDVSYGRPSIEDIELGVRVHLKGQRMLLDPNIQGKHLKTWTLGNLIQTDVFARGIPWTELILKTGYLPNDLNVGRSQRVSIFLAGLLPVGLAAGFAMPLLWAPVPACACVLLVLNWNFYRFLAVRRGWGFALRSIGLHWLYFLYSGFSFAAGVVKHFRKTFGSGGAKQERCA